MSYIVIKYDEGVIYLKPDFREDVLYKGENMVIEYYFFERSVQLFAHYKNGTTLADGPDIKTAKRILKERLEYIDSLN